jgi:metal-responsive CopG/Arc/MetJ family transcriptional regulator
MTNQITVRVPAALVQAIDKEALRQRRSRSDVVRLILEASFSESSEPSASIWERTRHLVGITSLPPDAAERHSDYVSERIRERAAPR